MDWFGWVVLYLALNVALTVLILVRGAIKNGQHWTKGLASETLGFWVVGFFCALPLLITGLVMHRVGRLRRVR